MMTRIIMMLKTATLEMIIWNGVLIPTGIRCDDRNLWRSGKKSGRDTVVVVLG